MPIHAKFGSIWACRTTNEIDTTKRAFVHWRLGSWFANHRACVAHAVIKQRKVFVQFAIVRIVAFFKALCPIQGQLCHGIVAAVNFDAHLKSLSRHLGRTCKLLHPYAVWNQINQRAGIVAMVGAHILKQQRINETGYLEMAKYGRALTRDVSVSLVYT